MRILKKAVTLIDIAKACDTSNVTVSKALAGKSGVSDALREKIKHPSSSVKSHQDLILQNPSDSGKHQV